MIADDTGMAAASLYQCLSSRLGGTPQAPSVYVIAEIGVNHDGDANTAKRLIDTAAGAGADAVKFQYFRAARLLSNQAELAGYQQGSAKSQQALLERLALDAPTLVELSRHTKQAGLGMIVTPFSPGDVDELEAMGLDAVKIASPDAVNPRLIEAAQKLCLPLLISTGTCTCEELEPAAQVLRDHEASGAFLQCVSSYPTPDDASGLGGIGALSDRFNLAVGYSDHTASLLTGALAVASGAVVIEKHLTHNCDAVGPDHAASLDPEGLTQYIQQVRLAQRMIGLRVKDVDPCEADVKRVSRQSLCALRDLPKGHVLGDGDLTVKRPGTGIPAARWEEAIGRRLARGVSANDLLMPGDLTEKASSV